MNFNPANFVALAASNAAQSGNPVPPAILDTALKIQALEQAAARFALRTRQDDFCVRSREACLDIAAKLQRFGSFASPAQAAYADKLVAWSQPYSAQIEATVKPPVPVAAPAPVAPAPRLVLPKLIDLMQRLAKLRIGDLTISRKNGEAYCWIKHSACDRVVGKIEGNGTFALFSRPGVNQADLLAALLDIEKDPEAAAVLHGKLSGNCSVCGRDLTDPESVARGIGPICAGKF